MKKTNTKKKEFFEGPREENDSTEKKSTIADIFKKVVTTGVGAYFLTEEALKNTLSDVSLPKDIVSAVLQNAKHVKEEATDLLKTEMQNYLKKVDLSKEVTKIFEHFDVEVNATIKFKKKDSAK